MTFINFIKTKKRLLLLIALIIVVCSIPLFIWLRMALQPSVVGRPVYVLTDRSGARTYVITEDGSLWGWGAAPRGYSLTFLSLDVAGSRRPIHIMDGVADIAVSHNIMMIIDLENNLWQWRTSRYIQDSLLWGGERVRVADYELDPILVMENVVYISASSGGHFMAIDTDGTLWAWGNNRFGQLGIGVFDYFNEPHEEPVRVMENIVFVTTAPSYTLAIDIDGTLWAWGSNFRGVLGDGTCESKSTPVPILDNIVYASAGSRNAKAIDVYGTLWAWGFNSGLLGVVAHLSRCINCDANFGRNWHQPYPLSVKENVISVSVGCYTSLAITADNTLWSWGSSHFGLLGGRGKEGVVFASIAYSHAVVISEDGTLWSWGRNHSGQLGNGTTSNIGGNRPGRVR